MAEQVFARTTGAISICRDKFGGRRRHIRDGAIERIGVQVGVSVHGVILMCIVGGIIPHIITLVAIFR